MNTHKFPQQQEVHVPPQLNNTNISISNAAMLDNKVTHNTSTPITVLYSELNRIIGLVHSNTTVAFLGEVALVRF